MNNSNELYGQWLERVADKTLSAELLAIKDDENEVNERFYRTLAFGTAGLRGILGAGTNRMNIYTVGAATQGFAEYLLAKYESPSAAIAFDSRHNSELFAKTTAAILAANGVQVWLYRTLMPTPALSFAILQLSCSAGVVITASHNPGKYNGYKAYSDDGSQISPEVAEDILARTEKVDYFTGIKTGSFEQSLAAGQIKYIPQETEEAYIKAVLAESLDPNVCRDTPISVVYTPLNGAGNLPVRRVLSEIGVTDLTVVPEQELPDGDFPTCPFPNPEEPTAMALGLALAEKLGSDILLATDPDSDRAGVAVRHGGKYVCLTGNEIGVLMLRYIITRRKELGTLPQRPVVVKSVVSTKLADKLAAEMGAELVDVLTGFKFIGEQIALLEQKGEVERFVLGFEESSGYLTGPHARDKDAVNAAVIICEMTAYYKSRGKTLLDVMDDIYAVCGRYLSVVDSYTFEGADGGIKMAEMLKALRTGSIKTIGGFPVAAAGDYLSGKRVMAGGEQRITLPAADILEYTLENGATVIVRPSGTEPKIKVYYSVVADNLENAKGLYDEISAGVKSLLGV